VHANKAVLILATMAVAAPVLAQEAGIEPASQISDGGVAQSSGDALPDSRSPISRAWWSRVLEGHFAVGVGTTKPRRTILMVQTGTSPNSWVGASPSRRTVAGWNSRSRISAMPDSKNRTEARIF
jgi:hypothetical protein